MIGDMRLLSHARSREIAFRSVSATRARGIVAGRAKFQPCVCLTFLDSSGNVALNVDTSGQVCVPLEHRERLPREFAGSRISANRFVRLPGATRSPFILGFKSSGRWKLTPRFTLMGDSCLSTAIGR